MSSPAIPRATSARYDATSSTVAPHTTTRERLLSLDVFRGLTIAGMLLVNDPGTWSAIFPPLEHAAWDGWTPTDLIFPFFLFIAGVTTHLSLEARRRHLGAATAFFDGLPVKTGGPASNCSTSSSQTRITW